MKRSEAHLYLDGEFPTADISEQPPQTPEFTLRFGDEFIYEDEILDAIIAKLEESGLYKDTLVFCGFGRTVSTRQRAQFWAYDEDDYRARVAGNSGATDAPHKYAFDEAEGNGGSPVVDVYDLDGVDLEELSPYYYELAQGVTLDQIRVASFILHDQ